MYCTDKDTLSDPAALAMYNFIREKVQVIFEPPLAEEFEMLTADDKEIMHNVLVKLPQDKRLSMLVADLPADIRDKILEAAPDGVLTGSDEQNVMAAFMYCTDMGTLSDPAALAMHNFIRDKVHQVMFEPPLAESFEMLTVDDKEIMHNVLVTAASDAKFKMLVADLPADIRDKILKAAPDGVLTGSVDDI